MQNERSTADGDTELLIPENENSRGKGRDRERVSLSRRLCSFFLLLIAILAAFLFIVFPSRRQSNFMSEGLRRPTQYEWAHAVNSRKLLKDAVLPAKKITAIEADIIFSQAKQQPVMGHPPAKDSDLTLQEFLDTIVRTKFQGAKGSANKNIVKLDFKSEAAFEPSVSLIRDFLAKTGGAPSAVWVNADILAGPNGSQPLFNASKFIQQALEIGPVVLSVGWTTGGSRSESLLQKIQRWAKRFTNSELPSVFSTEPYTPAMVSEMLALLPPGVPVTFPIKAPLLASSWAALKPLLDRREHSLTLWYSKSKMDIPSIQEIWSLLESTEELRNRTFYDLKGFDEFVTAQRLQQTRKKKGGTGRELAKSESKRRRVAKQSGI